MPSYAPYGNAIYGETVYGVPPAITLSTTVTVQPVLSAVGTYNSLQVSWVLPGQTWNQLLLARSSYGVPVSPFSSDGVTLLDVSGGPYPTTFVDTGLTSGRFYYYGLFVFDTAINAWILVGAAEGLCLTAFNFAQRYISWTPDWYLEQDAQLITKAQPQGPLQRLLNLLGFEMDWLRSEVESLFTLTSPEFISGALLPYMASNLGIGYEPQLGMTRSRVLIENAVQLYKSKGTARGSTAVPGGIQGAASAYSGYSCVLTLSQNQEIQLDDAAFDQSVGHWVPGNAGTSISTVPTASLGVTSQHSIYNPIPTDTGLQTVYGISGYMPPDNQNVLQITAQSSATWTQLIQTQTFPPLRANAAVAYNTSASQFLMYGGSYNTNLFDTWSWNGTSWTQLFPTTVPQVQFPLACYDITHNQIILTGANANTGVFETWLWSGTNWVKQAPATSPTTAGFAMAPGKIGATLEVLLLAGSAPGSLSFWAWNGTTWAQQAAPPMFPGAAMGYDPTSGNTVTFGGGYSSGHSIFLDGSTYVWNGSSWSNPTPSTTPARGTGFMTSAATSGHSLIYVDANQVTWSYNVGSSIWTQLAGANTNIRYNPIAYYTGTTVVSFTGTTPSTQVFSGSTWSTVTGATVPLPRWAAHMAQSSTGTVYLFGGYNPIYGYLNDTWSWNGTTWTQLSPATSPTGRSGGGFVSIGGGVMVLFGGGNGVSNFNETWTFNGTTWTHVTTTGTPGARAFPVMVFDSNISRVVLFSGNNGVADTWYYNNGTTTWTQQAPANSPPALSGATMVYTTGGNSILFGGQLGSGNQSAQTWQWNSGGTPNWTQLTPATSPPARQYASMVYDASISTTFLFGGAAGGSSLNVFPTDMWAYAAGVWTQVTPPTVPLPRISGAAVYITSSATLLLFGGGLSFATTEPSLGDTWSMSEAAYGVYITECNSATATTLGIPVTGGTALGLVQKGDSGNGLQLSGASVSVLPNNTTPGNTVVICIANSSANANDVLSLTSGMFAFATKINTVGNNSGYGMDIWVASVTGAAKTLAVNLTGGAWTAAVFEFPGSYTATSAGTQTGPSASTITQNFGGLAGGQQIVLALAQCAFNPFTPPGAPWSDYGGTGTQWNPADGLDVAWQVSPAGNSAAATWTGLAGNPFTMNGLILTSTNPAPKQVVFSAYFQPVPSATPTLQFFFTQLDWYGINGGFISSTVGTPVHESVQGGAHWVRASVVGTPPLNAVYFGRTVKSQSTAMTGDLHLMDAVQTELNTQATPGPTAWTPPRDFQLNLLPYRQNLVVNAQGLSGTFGFTANPGTFQGGTFGISWPEGATSGFRLTTNNLGAGTVTTANMPVIPNAPYSFSVQVEKVIAGAQGSWTVSINWRTASNTLISTVTSPVFSETSGAFASFFLANQIAPANAAFATATINVTGGGTTTAHYIGVPLFEPSSSVNTFFDGNFSPSLDFSFEGTPNQSISDYYPNFANRVARLVTVMPEFIPIGSTFSIFTGAQAFANAGLAG